LVVSHHNLDIHNIASVKKDQLHVTKNQLMTGRVSIVALVSLNKTYKRARHEEVIHIYIAHILPDNIEPLVKERVAFAAVLFAAVVAFSAP
jgi:hypothetical protein